MKSIPKQPILGVKITILVTNFSKGFKKNLKLMKKKFQKLLQSLQYHFKTCL